ncbi:MAG: alkaline shock response membrane anchor protein AmaP [Candidatus Omnitrophota bacterium]
MKTFNMILIFIYTMIFSVIGALLIAISFHAEYFNLFKSLTDQISQQNNLRLGLAGLGFLMMVVNISIVQLSLNRLRKDKNIAFDNPYGRVTVSLTAIEDYIKKLTNEMSEVKEIKSSINSIKSGIEVNAKVILYSGFNIPEVTEKIQSAIKMRLQEMLGLEETVVIKVHVVKIISTEKKHPTTDVPESGY